jgi:SAM-dependent methyltransferase
MSTKHPTAREFRKSNDPALEREFLSRVMLPCGAFMTTDRNRLADVDTLLMLHLPSRGPLDIMDVAVSSGITTVELARRFPNHRIIATDRMPTARLVHVFKGFDVLVDDSRNVLHFDIAGFGFSPSRSTVLRPFKAAALQLFKALDRPSLPADEVTLKSQLANGLSVVTDDVFEQNPPEWIGRFDVIRAANILNLAYFHPDRIRAGVATLKQRLKNGGLLLVARTVARSLMYVPTNDWVSANDATIFRLDCGKLSVIGRLGNGSEIEDIVLSY